MISINNRLCIKCDNIMHRRRFLAYGSVLAVGLVGCMSRTADRPAGSTSTLNSPGYPNSTSSTDGYPSSVAEPPTEHAIDTAAFETVERDGIAVPLAPVDVTHYWHQRREARFADARGQSQYDRSHIRGAVLSPAPHGGNADPVEEWPKGDRIVCYCGCPHHLSSMRAASLLSNGYENVYVIDEGVWEWQEQGYPMAGTKATTQPEVRVIRGRTADTFAGRTVWARHEPTGQREATAIGPDGTYALELKFADITASSLIVVRTPDYTLERSLGDLTKGLVNG